MSLRNTLPWSLLGFAGLMELALLASGINELFTNPTYKLNTGPAGSIELIFRGQAYQTIGLIVILLVLMAIIVAAWTRDYVAIIVASCGCAAFASFFSNVMPTGQGTSFWRITAAGLVVLVATIGRSHFRATETAEATATTS